MFMITYYHTAICVLKFQPFHQEYKVRIGVQCTKKDLFTFCGDVLERLFL